MHKKNLIVTSIAAVSLVLGGCASGGSGMTESDLDPSALGSQEAQDAMAEMYEAALDANENSVVVYGPGEELYTEAYRKFSERYPEIQVTGEYIFGAQLSARLDQEFGSGNQVGSVQTGGPAMTLASSEADRCESFEPISQESMRYYLPEAVADDHTFNAVVGYPFGIAYNTEVAGEAPPEGWADMADPKWEGNFVLEDPRQVNGSSQTIAQLLHGEVFEEDWLSKVHGNDPQIRGNSAQTVQSVSTGQVAFDGIAQYVMYQPAIESGEPIDFVFPTAGPARMEYHYTCRLAGGPNPNATDLFMNWLFTPEGQQALSDTGVYGLHEEASAPADFPDLDEIEESLIRPSPMGEANDVTTEGIQEAIRIFG